MSKYYPFDRNYLPEDYRDITMSDLYKKKPVMIKPGNPGSPQYVYIGDKFSEKKGGENVHYAEGYGIAFMCSNSAKCPFGLPHDANYILINGVFEKNQLKFGQRIEKLSGMVSVYEGMFRRASKQDPTCVMIQGTEVTRQFREGYDPDVQPTKVIFCPTVDCTDRSEFYEKKYNEGTSARDMRLKKWLDVLIEIPAVNHEAQMFQPLEFYNSRVKQAADGFCKMYDDLGNRNYNEIVTADSLSVVQTICHNIKNQFDNDN